MSIYAASSSSGVGVEPDQRFTGDEPSTTAPPPQKPKARRSRSSSGLLGASRQSERVAEVLARDADAVQSTITEEQKKIGLILTATDGTPSMRCRAMQLMLLVTAICLATSSAPGQAETAGLTEPTELLWVAGFLSSMGWAFVTLVISSAREALRPGDGALVKLGVGQTSISTDDAQYITRRRNILLGISVFMAAAGVVEIGSALSGGGMLPESAPLVTRFIWMIIGLLAITAMPVGFSGWWASMYTGTCLVRNDEIAVIKSIRSIDPTSSSWDDLVPPALALIEKLEVLSDGWSDGLAGLCGMSGCFALSFFVKAIDPVYCDGMDDALGRTPGTQRYGCLAEAAGFGAFPIFLARDLAETSTYCNIIMDELNRARKRYGVDSHMRLSWLETTYRRLNRGKGMGFMVGGIVINTQSLAYYGTKLFSVLSTIVTALLAYSSARGAGGGVGEDTGDTMCKLTKVQITTIQALLAESNANCSYDYSLASIIDTGH